MTVDQERSPPSDWDSYVARNSAATAYHRADAVRVGTRAFGLPSYFLTARDSERRIVGILPLVEQSSVLFGRYIISVPYFTYGGAVADDGPTAEALVEKAIEIARERKAGHLELRHTAAWDLLGLERRTDKVSMVLSLPADADGLAKALGSKLRSQIRRGERGTPEIIWGKAELLDDFYRVFASTMHQLGTPVYARRFFKVVVEALDGAVELLVFRMGGEPCAAAVVVQHGSRLEVPWAAATPRAKSASINMRMYWEMLTRAIDRGFESFDFGRSSPGGGTYRFKAQWGAEPQQLYWHYWLRGGGPIPQLNHSNRKYALAAAAWRRLPLWCANALGPFLARNLP
jgi:FemAB-related protein (PEP-CTERM system-associated)